MNRYFSELKIHRKLFKVNSSIILKKKNSTIKHYNILTKSLCKVLIYCWPGIIVKVRIQNKQTL